MWGASKITPRSDAVAAKKFSSPSLSVTNSRLFAIGGIQDLPISKIVEAVLVKLACVIFSISAEVFALKQVAKFFWVTNFALVGKR